LRRVVAARQLAERRRVERVEDGLQVLEAHLLRPGLLFRHVVDTEELVVTEKTSVHCHDFLIACSGCGGARWAGVARLS